MSSRNSALASLTATYTDSENEEEHSDEGSEHTESSNESQVIIPPPPKPSYTPVRKTPDANASVVEVNKSQNTSGSLRLVSYNDDTVVSDDENVSPNRDFVSMDISEDEPEPVVEEPPAEPEVNKYAHYGFSLPPEPKGKVPNELQDKIVNLYEKMRTNNMDMNKIIQERKEFRNPSIYEKLIQFCDINELGTNYPPEIYDPLQWGPESYYEELSKSQKTEMLKRQKERKESDKADQAAVALKKAEEEAKKRKSKWDQPAASVIKSSIPPPSLTSNVTGTKGTVISAFGSLPKKLTM